MARRKTDKQLVEELTRTMEPKMRAAFRSVVRDIVDNATIKVIADMIGKGDVAGALFALGIEPSAYGPLDQALDEIYYGSGKAAVDNFPEVRSPDGLRTVFRFGVRNNEAEFWLRGHSSMLVTRLVDDQREAIRSVLAAGLSEGRNPRTTALDIAGRYNRQSGRREGGIIGLTAAQSRATLKARLELAAGDPAYFSRKLRDKRFDGMIRKAQAAGETIDPVAISKIVGRYSDSLLRLRGETIARTETLTALNKARNDAVRQQVLAGKIDAQDVTKVWQAAVDERTRGTHRALHGKAVALDGSFQSPSGARLAYPGDPNAPAREHVNCRCWLRLDVDFLGQVVRSRRAA